MARADALSQGRTFITIQDLPLPIKIVLSTASIDRVNIFDLLIAHDGFLTTSITTKSLNTNHHRAHRIMAELKAVDLVDIKDTESQTDQNRITLKHEFDWFLTDESNRTWILEKKKVYNQTLEAKQHNAEYHKQYYEQHREKFKKKNRDYHRSRKKVKVIGRIYKLS